MKHKINHMHDFVKWAQAGYIIDTIPSECTICEFQKPGVMIYDTAFTKPRFLCNDCKTDFVMVRDTLDTIKVAGGKK